jgi:hypothetical protein
VALGVHDRRLAQHRAVGGQPLLVPSLALLEVWATPAAVAEGIFHLDWFGRAALLIVSPLWFIVVSLALVLLTPLAIRLHQRFGPLFPLHTTGYAIAFALLWLAGNRGHGPARDGPVPTGGTALSVGPTGL